QGKLAEGVISKASYVWADGMADWVLMTEVPLLAPLYLGGSGPVAPTPEQAQALAAEVPELTENSQSQIAPPVNEAEAQPMSVALSEPVNEPSSPRSSFVAPSGPLELSLGAATATGVTLAQHPETRLSSPMGSVAIAGDRYIPERVEIESPRRKSRKGHGRMKRVARYAAIAAVAGGVWYANDRGYLEPVLKSPVVGSALGQVSDLASPIVAKLVEKAPFLNRFLSPIPELADVAPEEFQELRAAAVASPSSGNPMFAVALSKTSVESPAFYVAANVQDGTQLKLVFDGVPETLLNASTFNQVLSVVITKRLGRTGALKTGTGGSVPRGQYLVSLIDPTDAAPSARPGEKPSAIRPLVAKSYFLGGVKDALYASRLKEFHETLTLKAGEELVEAKAYADHFEKQLAESTQQFSFTRQGAKVMPTRRKVWEKFHGKWLKSWGQMSQNFSKWTPEAVRADRYYAGLFLALMQTAQAVEGVHKFQDTIISGAGDRKALEVQLGEAESGASKAVADLKLRIEKIEKSPISVSGMPAREDVGA
ncbi:MAG TPA: hypothetical protein VM598_05365, partial [Bdellovibrionota bacterium]|nr:hypothetical protein [Bdellovibrionota bacterium]